MSNPALITRLVRSAPCVDCHAIFVRRVELEALQAYSPPNFLYTSGKPGRYNIDGMDCLYVSENEETAKAEYERLWKHRPGKQQPVVTFFAKVSLTKILDLTDPAILAHLKLTDKDLHESWRLATRPTKTQLVGFAAASRASIAGIQYPSDATTAGANLVIFHRNVKSPDFVKILGPGRKPLQVWT